MVARRNVTLLEVPDGGVRSFQLLGPTGVPISSFAAFAKSLLRAPFNTRRSYCSSVADFFDYYFEAGCHLTASAESEGLTKVQLRDIIDGWRGYLIGFSGDDDVACLVASTLPSPRVSSNTAATKHAALSKFLRLSERHRKQASDFKMIGLRTAEVDYEPLLDELGVLRTIGVFERRQMLKASMLASVTAQGVSERAAPLFQGITPAFDIKSAFPLDRFEEFVDVLPSYRDKALYCLYAASGCRAHEGLQLLWDDLDIPNGSVSLVSPLSRLNHSSYAPLSKIERDSLAWKGRETSETFLIEPFASMFFENLEKYYHEEYYPHGRHQFVFQILRRPSHGRPYFLTDTTTRQEVFDTAARKIGLPDSVSGPHSLRHAYATYLVNYLPLINGEYGLPIGLVRVAMGHASIESTKKYAVLDKDIITAHVQFANLQVFHKGQTRGQLQFKIMALECQIAKLRNLEKLMAQ